MKKILLAAMAALAITGCSQNEEFEAPAQKAEISFNTAVTRAVEMNTSALKQEGFQVYAYNTGTNDMSTEIALSDSPWIKGLASFDSNSSEWSVAGGPYYWPLTEKLQFFAYSPTTGVSYTEPNGTDKGYPKFTYTVQTDAANQKDLVIASVENKTKVENGVTPAVSLTFKHALTQINIQVIQEDANYTYEVEPTVTISGIKGNGTFTYTGVNTGAWTTGSTDATYTYTLGDITDGSSAITASNALMLIPQDITNAKITIKYKTKKGNSYVFNDKKEIPLAETTPAWGFGTKILYKLTLPVGGEKVKIEGEADKWDTETQGGEKTPETPAA